MNNRNRNEPLLFVEPEQNRTTAVRVNFFPISDGTYNFDSTSIQRPFDCLSKVIKVTETQAAIRSHADLFIYLFIYSSAE